ncbi:MAG: DUF309 domain-containing protein [Candidatus Nanopelagicales bacterium]
MPERARDRLGRPLPADADPGLVVPGVPADLEPDGPTALALAADYLDRGLPFHVHEVYELRWRCCPEDERGAWRALAQWGAALTHAARGNPVGATALAQRAAAGLRAYDGPPIDGLDIDAVLTSCARLERAAAEPVRGDATAADRRSPGAR